MSGGGTDRWRIVCSPEYKPSRKNRLERLGGNTNAVRLGRI